MTSRLNRPFGWWCPSTPLFNFALFGDIRCYVSFFLLEGLVTDGRSLKFFRPFNNFQPPKVPKDASIYMVYRLRWIERPDG